MKNLILISLLLISTTAFTAPKTTNGGLLNYSTVVDINDYKGQTFFSLMTDVIKPALDQYAQDGFVVVDGRTALSA